MHVYFTASVAPATGAGEVTLAEPAGVDREVLVHEVPVPVTGSTEPPGVTVLDTRAYGDCPEHPPGPADRGFTLLQGAGRFTLAAHHWLIATSDPALVARLEVLVTPPHHERG